MEEKQTTVEELLYQLISHWRFWNVYGDFYLNTLVPQLTNNPGSGNETERRIFNLLKKKLNANALSKLPSLIKEKLPEVLRQIELEKQRQKAEMRAREEEVERKEQQRILEEMRKKPALLRIKECLKNDFLNADRVYQEKISRIVTLEEYETEKINFVQSWARKHTDTKLDDEQALAVSTYNTHLLVIARAGSGKTTTLVNRAIFLQKHCRIPPNQMIILAFNKKAVETIEERLKAHLGNDIPYVMTFHALAYAVVHPEKGLLYDDSISNSQAKSRVLQTVIHDHLQDPTYKNKIRNLMLEHFRSDWVRIIEGGFDKAKKDMLKFRRSLPNVSLRGDYLRSYGEKLIADFLFEHDILYMYERNFWWGGINYRPDFTIFQSKDSGIVVEYFGMKGNPDYDELTEEKRKYWKQKSNWTLLEISPQHIASGHDHFYEYFKELLKGNGIKCTRLPENEIWRRVREIAIHRFTKTTVGFIQRCRSLSLTPQQLEKRISTHRSLNSVEEQFLNIALHLYQAYLKRLNETGDEDFDGLMQHAARLIKAGQTKFERKSGKGDIRGIYYIFIDEYQDFSDLFNKLIEAIRSQKQDIEFFCVGDDWQAIYGFAGSDLQFFEKFQKYFTLSRELHISTNYRSNKSIVTLGNALMDGLGRPARAHKSETGTVLLGYLDDFKPSGREKERHAGDKITPVVLRIISKELPTDRNVVLISRKNMLPWYINFEAQYSNQRNDLEAYLDLVRSYFPKKSRKRIMISTAHRYKGLQNNVVVVLDAVNCSYPLIHPDWIFTRVLGDNLEKITLEERRLFYVTLTRAVESLIILTEKSSISPLLEDILSKQNVSKVNWKKYPPMKDIDSRLTVLIEGDTYAIKDQLKASGYQWDPNAKVWHKSFINDGFLQRVLQESIWSSTANNINVKIVDDHESLVAEYHINNGQWETL